jgi:hypothetical protein
MLVMDVHQKQAGAANSPVPSIDDVHESVVAIADEANELADIALKTSSRYNTPDATFTPELLESAMHAMRTLLEREDALTAQAKAALLDARAAAINVPDEAAKIAVAAALGVYDLTREMRTRTHTNLTEFAEIADQLSNSGSDALVKAQAHVAARIAEGRKALDRIRTQAAAIAGK